jgi:hypothetical protein
MMQAVTRPHSLFDSGHRPLVLVVWETGYPPPAGLLPLGDRIFCVWPESKWLPSTSARWASSLIRCRLAITFPNWNSSFQTVHPLLESNPFWPSCDKAWNGWKGRRTEFAILDPPELILLRPSSRNPNRRRFSGLRFRPHPCASRIPSEISFPFIAMGLIPDLFDSPVVVEHQHASLS